MKVWVVILFLLMCLAYVVLKNRFVADGGSNNKAANKLKRELKARASLAAPVFWTGFCKSIYDLNVENVALGAKPVSTAIIRSKFKKSLERVAGAPFPEEEYTELFDTVANYLKNNIDDYKTMCKGRKSKEIKSDYENLMYEVAKFRILNNRDGDDEDPSEMESGYS